MNRLAGILTLTCVVCLGCGQAPGSPVNPRSPDAGSSATSGGECTDVVETVLPGQNGARVVALCTSCDRGCDDKGPTCAAYGDSCDFFGAPGVCGACCDGDRGALRCHAVDAKPAEECSLPNVGPAPRTCAVDDDCSWSQCSVSSCIQGKCVHEKVTDGATCGDTDGLMGTCDECLCTIET